RMEKTATARLRAMAGYLSAGVFLGAVLIVTVLVTRNDAAAATAASGGNAVTDNVVRLRDVEGTCFRGVESETARLTVSLEVGIDGKVRYATAAGGSAPLRTCVERHVKTWEFLPQAQPQSMVLPFEVARRGRF